MVSREERLDRLLLAQEIAEFLYHEAELLDERRYRRMADAAGRRRPLLDADAAQRQIRRRASANSPATRTDINWFDEGKETLARRVKQIQTGIHWAEEPVSRISHLVSNVQVLEATPSLGRRRARSRSNAAS